MKKTNAGLVQYAKNLIQQDARYWFGCWGQIGNAKLLSSKHNQYPKYLSDKRVQIAKDRGDFGHPVTDCIGIPKGYLMQEKEGFPPEKYVAAYDLSADGYFKQATEKGEISSIPEIIGLGLYKKGHAGIYIGGGRVIEAKGFDYGVIEDSLSDTPWTHWYKIPWIEYIDADQSIPDPVEEPAPSPVDDIASDVGFYIVQKGDTLSKIAKKFGTTVKKLAEINGISNPDLIQIGQKILLGGASAIEPDLIRDGIVCTQKYPLNIRQTPNGRIIGQIPKGAKVSIVGDVKEGWLKLAGRDGYVFAAFVRF